MSRITGSDAKALMEAYAAVYAPQQEEVIEEIFEDDVEQIDEASARSGRVTGSNQNVFRPATTSSGPAGGGMGGMRGTGRNRNSSQTSSSPGALRVKPNPAAAAPAAAAPAPNPAAPAPKPAAAAPAPKPAAKVAPAPAAKPAAAPARTFNPLMQKTFGYQTGQAPDQIRAKSAPSPTPAPKPATPTNRATGSKKPGSAFEQYDAYDVVLEYLFDNGHVDTVDEAHYVMLEMDAEMIAAIVEEKIQVNEADSLAAMQARREKRLAAQRKREGTTSTGRDFGRDDRLSAAQQKERRDAEYKAGTKKEEFEAWIDEAIYSEKGKAKAAEMIAKRSTPSGRAKPGKGANVAQIRQIRGSGRGRFDREGLGGTPMTPTMAKNPIKKQNYDGTGNKAARRAAELKKEEFEFWVNSLVEEGYDLSGYTWDEMYEFYLDEAEKPFPHEKVERKQKELRDKGGNALDRRMKMGLARRRAKEAEKTGGSQRDAGKGWYHSKEAFEAWIDEAMTNYEKNRKRAAQRAAARNEARAQGKTGAVPGVGYVTPRKERETWTDESGKTRHAKGL
jgi:hypothetical protein